MGSPSTLSSLDIHVERVLSFIKFKSPLISDSFIDFLGKNCYPHFSVEKMETEKHQDTRPVHKAVPNRIRIISQGLILTPHSSSHCSEASQEEEGRCDVAMVWPPLDHDAEGPPACTGAAASGS